jgi:hypothetical protein
LNSPEWTTHSRERARPRCAPSHRERPDQPSRHRGRRALTFAVTSATAGSAREPQTSQIPVHSPPGTSAR